jgi:hypothetical protein
VSMRYARFLKEGARRGDGCYDNEEDFSNNLRALYSNAFPRSRAFASHKRAFGDDAPLSPDDPAEIAVLGNLRAERRRSLEVLHPEVLLDGQSSRPKGDQRPQTTGGDPSSPFKTRSSTLQRVDE